MKVKAIVLGRSHPSQNETGQERAVPVEEPLKGSQNHKRSGSNTSENNTRRKIASRVSLHPSEEMPYLCVLRRIPSILSLFVHGRLV